ncbi:hypothetical protein NPIL_504931 [Nephila pilipes]|uniref:Uncharacterized protein n=1 Tax=Nephila pilipes TaxID=299642 RepID=A0A8X6R245_NEPPI|nr:hypothetical protein NPIL_504931 [Nephila pilipes]
MTIDRLKSDNVLVEDTSVENNQRTPKNILPFLSFNDISDQHVVEVSVDSSCAVVYSYTEALEGTLY